MNCSQKKRFGDRRSSNLKISPVSSAVRLWAERLESRVLLSTSVTPVVAAPYQPPIHQIPAHADGLLSSPVHGKALNIALSYLRGHAGALGLRAGDLANPLVTDQYTDAGTGETHIYLQQRVNGLAVANTSLSISLTRDNRVITAGGDFVHLGTIKGTKPALQATQALTHLAPGLGLTANASPSLLTQNAASNSATLSSPQLSKDPITAKAEYVATASGLKLAWRMVLRTPDGQHWYETYSDGTTGASLGTVDWTDHLESYDVYPLPEESPNDGARSVVTDPADPAYSPYGWHDTNGATGAEYTVTRGNNVNAYIDSNNSNTVGFQPDGGGALNFDFPIDVSQQPSTYQSASDSQLYYLVNELHDIHAHYGFTEAAGNFQQTDYSGQGLGSDAVLAEAQDGGGIDNANFATPPDGQAPRMQMYLWDKTNPKLDGALDSEVVVHEFGHGISNRLTGGPANASALTALQSGGMGEGWSDWWAMMLTQKPSNAQNDAYPAATYVMGQSPITGAGIRRYPYSYNMSIDPLTFARYGQSGDTEVHDTGEIWASTLWDLNWLLIQKYGYSPTIAQGYSPNVAGQNGGNNLALKLVMDALKLQPANPSFINARDAIIAADQAIDGGADLLQIWTAFARRGLGKSAVDASASSTTITTATDLPAAVQNPQVVSQSPTGALTSPVLSLDFTFSKAMDPASFSVAADVASFTGPGATNLLPHITGFSWLNSNTTLHVTFAPQSTSGRYTMVIGPQILSADNQAPMDQNTNGTTGEPTADQYTATFGYETTLLQVSSTTPDGATAVTMPFTSLDVHFNRAFDPATVAASDLILGQGTVTAANVIDPTTVRYTISGANREDLVSLSIPAGAMNDTDGFGMLAFLGLISLDIGTQALPAVTSVTPRAPMVYQSTFTASLNTATDTDSFTINLDPGQTLTAVVHRTALIMRPSVSVFGPDGALLGSASTNVNNQDVVVQTLPVTTAGKYSIVVGSDGTTIGQYSVQALINGAVESEEHGGPADDTQATAQSLDPSMRPLTGGASIGAVMGTLAASATDYYSLSIAGGQLLSATMSFSAGASLALYDSGGTLLASATGTATNYQASIGSYAVSSAGTYYLKVAGSSTDYALSATRDSAFSLEPNNSIATAQTVGWNKAVAGTIGGTATGNIKMGLIQDSLPWGQSSNTTVATALGYTVTIIPSSSLSTLNFAAYDMVVLAGDQTATTYANVQASLARIQSYVSAGGVWVADDAASSTSLPYGYSLLPGASGITFSTSSGTDINVLASSSGLINGPGGTITNTTLDNGTPSYQGYTVSALPAGATAILSTSTASRIVAFDYPDGAGHVVVQTIPVEYYNASGNFSIFHKNLFAFGASFKANTNDYYSFFLSAGQTLRLATSTPGDGPGEPVNAFDPVLTLYNSAGAQVAVDDNGASDGRNASIAYSATSAGAYYVRVSGSPNSPPSGEYVLNLVGQPISITLPITAMETAGTVQGTLTVPSAPASDLPVTLTSSDASRVSVPSTVVIPAGQTSVSFTANMVDNSLLDGIEAVTITASESSHSPGISTITVQDDESAALTVSLPATVSEGAGTLIGTVASSAAPTRDIVVALSSNLRGRLTVPATVTLKAGQTSATFVATVVDNTVIDGTQLATVSAATGNWIDGTTSVAVIDNDNTLAVTLPSWAWEGQMLPSAGTVQIGGTLTTNLVVNLVSSDTSALTVPATVTIPAGQTSAAFTITLSNDGIAAGSRSVGVTATASGVFAGSAILAIHDAALDHLTWDPITTGAIAGSPFVATARAINVAGEVIAVYSGSGTLSATGQGGALPVTPTTVAFNSGIWSSPVTVNTADPALKLAVTTGGVSASTTLVVQGGAVANFTWAGVASPQYGNLAFPVTITAKDAYGNVASAFQGSVALSPEIGVPTSQTMLGGLRPDSQAFPVSQVTYGYAFTPKSNILVTHVRGFFGEKISIWTDSGTLLATQAIPYANNQWVETRLANPITLQAGTTYRLAAYIGSGGAVDWTKSLADPSFATIGPSYSGYGDAFPNQAFGGAAFFSIDFRGDVSAAPFTVAPATVTFVNGVWSGNISVPADATGMYIRATDSGGHSGDSNVFNVFFKALSFTLPSDINENGVPISGIVKVNAAPTSDLTVALSSSDPARLTVPATIVIPAGTMSAPVTLTPIDNALLDGLDPVTISASAQGNLSGNAIVNVHDNETAAVSLSLPAIVGEWDGSVTGTITASAAPTHDISVQLSSDSSRLNVPPVVTLKAGQTSATFNATIVNDSIINTTLAAAVTATVDNWINGAAVVTIQDDESSVIVTMPASGWEGQTLVNGGMVTIPAPRSASIVVNLTSTDTGALKVPASVTIPAFATTATFTLTLVDDGVTAGSRVPSVEATCAGLSTGNRSVVVHDATLHHLVIDPIVGPKTVGIIGATVRAYNVANEVISIYNGSGTLTAADSAGSAPVTPSSISFSAGVWSGNVTLTVASPAMTLTASSAGVTSSTTFAIQAGAAAAFSWASIPTSQIVNVPFAASVTAKDVYGNLANSFNGSISLSGQLGSASDQTMIGNLDYTNSYSVPGPFTLGFAFTLANSVLVTQVRSLFGSKVSIWTDGGTLLASQPVTAVPGTWSQTPLPAPIMLNAGATYRIAIFVDSQTYYWRNAAPPSPLFASIGQTYDAEGDVFPTLLDSTRWWPVDIRGMVNTFTSTPVTPAKATFVNGVWTGNVSVPVAATGMHLRVDDGAGHVGDSGILDVFAKSFTLTLPSTARKDDGAAPGVLNVSLAPTSDLTVTLTSSDPNRLSVPSTIVIPAGATSVPLPLTIVDNLLLDGSEAVTVSAAANAYTAARGTIDVQDNEIGTLSVSLPATAHEGDGTVTGTLSLNVVATHDIVVQLSSSNPSRATVASTVTLPAGQTSLNFNLNVVDDTLIDGTGLATIAATATGLIGGYKSINVLDNDNHITVTLPASGFEGQMLGGGIVRIGGILNSDLVVNLASADATEISVPGTLRIVAGQTSASFSFSLLNDSIQDGAQTASIIASTGGFVGGSSSLVVHDSDLNRLSITSPSGDVIAGPFAVSASAFNIDNELIPDYGGTVNVTAAGQAGTLPVTVGSFTFPGGVWNGTITETVADPAVRLTVSAGSISATSNVFVVKPGGVANLKWNSIPSPQVFNTPAKVTVTARDAYGNIATDDNGSVQLTGQTKGILSQTMLGNPMWNTFFPSSVPYTVGYAFTPKYDMQVSDVHAYFGSKISIWNDTGGLLASQVLARVNWQDTPLSTSITLLAGNTYRVTVLTTGQAHYARTSAPTNPFFATLGANYEGQGDAFPTTLDTNLWWLVDLRANVTTTISAPITPQTAVLANGVFTGTISVSQGMTGIWFHADDSAGHIADSNIVDVVGATQPPVLDAISDSGVSSTDGITNFNNGSAGKKLGFTVSGVYPGNSVEVYADGLKIGSATSTAATLDVICDGVTALSDGDHQITARQVTPAGESTLFSPATLIHVDTAPPSIRFTLVPASSGSTIVGQVVIDLDSAINDFPAVAPVLSRDGSGNLLSADQSIVQTGPTTYTLTNLATVDALGGIYVLTFADGQFTDVAGNTLAAPAVAQWTTDLLQGTAGDDSYYLKADGNQVDLWINQAASFAPTLKLSRGAVGQVIHGMGGNDTITLDESGGDLFAFLQSIDSVGVAAQGNVMVKVIGTTGDDAFALDGVAGTIQLGGNTVSVSQLSAVEYTDNGGNDQISVAGLAPLTLNVGAGIDTLNVGDNASAVAVISAFSGDLTINGNGSTELRYV